MKYILTALYISTLLYVTSVETNKNEILIKYSASQNDFYLFAINPQDKPDRIKSTDAITAFCNNQNNNLNIEVYARIGFLKIISIKSVANSYIEINYNSRTKILYLDSLLGDFNITSYNSHIQTVTRISGTEITNFASTYSIISYPDKNVFCKVIEGKINIKNEKDSILLITGESCEINGKYFNLSVITDMETSKIILNNRLFSRFENPIFKENSGQSNNSFKELKTNKKAKLNYPVKFKNLETIFSETVFKNGNFGYELEGRIESNPSFWNNFLKIYQVKH